MIEYLNKPFPFIENKKHRILASFMFSLFIYVFLLVFQPFGISNIQYYKPVFVFGFFLITLFVMFISFLVLPFIFKSSFDVDKWTIKKNLVFISEQFLIVAILNWAYNYTFGKGITEQHSLVFFMFITFAVGIIPTLFLMYFIEKKLALQNQNIADEFTNKVHEQANKLERTKIDLISKNNDEVISIDLDELICIKSEGNYLNVYFISQNIIKSKMIRNSITHIEEQLNNYKSIIRCHRSFLVNLDKVEKMSGNARNLNLHINNLDFKIPVSRSFPMEIFKNLDL